MFHFKRLAWCVVKKSVNHRLKNWNIDKALSIKLFFCIILEFLKSYANKDELKNAKTNEEMGVFGAGPCSNF